jgi:poly(A) polymerase
VASSMLERLRFSGKEAKLVEIVINYHMRPGQMSQQGLPTQRAIYRYFRDSGEAGIDILFLSLADHLATRGANLDMAGWREHARMVEYVLEKHFEQQELVEPNRLVDGNDLIDIFGLSPGPALGEILEAVREAQASGELASRQEALDYIRQRLASGRIVC